MFSITPYTAQKLFSFVLLYGISVALPVFAQVSGAQNGIAESTEPAKSDDTAFGLVDYLSRTGQHDVHDEKWNLYGQFTTIAFYKPRFRAAYTNLNGSNSSL